MVLISYGKVSNNFKTIAQMRKLLSAIKTNQIYPTRLDCYPIDSLSSFCKGEISGKFIECNLNIPSNYEVFYPSENYPSHIDEEGISYFIGLESGNFVIEDVSYPIVPFVLYSFEESKLHNTNFAAIMLK